MEIWFGQQNLIVKILIVASALPLFFLLMGTLAFMGMGFGTAGSHFGDKPKVRDVLIGTMGLGIVVTVGVAVVWGLIQIVSFILSLFSHLMALAIHA